MVTRRPGALRKRNRSPGLTAQPAADPTAADVKTLREKFQSEREQALKAKFPADTLAKADSGIRNVETIITGHSTLKPWRDLATYADFTRDFRDVVVNGFNHGLGVDEIAESWKLPAKYAGYAAPSQRVRAAVEAIVGELSRGQTP